MNNLIRSVRLRALVGVTLAVMLGACAQTPVPALENEQVLSPLATFRVTSRADAPDTRPGDGRCATKAGACTLRAAIQETNARSGADTVILPRGLFTLTLGEIVITDGLTLQGVNENALVDGGGSTTVIDAGGRSRVFVIDRAGFRPGVTLRGLTVRNGNERTSLYGGGIVVSKGSSVTLERLIIRDNRARLHGSGVSNFGFLTVRESTVYNNSPINSGELIDRHFYYSLGGGIYNGGLLALYDSTVYGNEATHGGGISTTYENSITVISNSTISGNTAWQWGGGIAHWGDQRRNVSSTMSIVSSTVTRNQGSLGGGIFNMGRLSLSGTILAENEMTTEDPHDFSPDETAKMSWGRVKDASLPTLLKYQDQ